MTCFNSCCILAVSKPREESKMRTVSVELTSVYGTTLCYPCEATAELFAELVKKRTFNAADISRIGQLGFEVKIISNGLKLEGM